jgi:hypothetical protein
MLNNLHGEAPLMTLNKEDYCLKCKKVVSTWKIFQRGEKYYKRCTKCKTEFPTKKPN